MAKKGKPLHPFWWWSGWASAAGMSAGMHSVAALGWVAFVAVMVLGAFVNTWHRSESDCWWCHGKSKRRGRDGEGSTFHPCMCPWWLGGCDGDGKRNRVLYWVTRRGLGR